jgi:hypothetical protein
MEPRFRLISLLFCSAYRSSRTHLSSEQPARQSIKARDTRFDDSILNPNEGGHDGHPYFLEDLILERNKALRGESQ